ncbi:acetyl/propionyl/methylcrotonyl-CoA carboxylase subunit alpha [Acidocella aminolytica]|jgi:acetyl-CoA/propionyl-CoA carboxylase biotin carboxyl carrier protein|uniref:biotin carboxylase n=1 Tax=Acidocella aminolytica 101 = DSM 11237 TaxID=1120923 RepID=A0A0D6PCS9_9PROT|nr:biotin carboxylase N-terminal domain-containing protein [Acidocella aminolytica]GAN79136.1 carbamoyl phosphate synthase large subunit [Acidocella aminolytica 101 = DSM 11237]GBQ43715.1 acetyl-CoA carboxylase biotin carboxylase subunit [Acidocella aminolytica 101 = DSM 11237]SHE66218.1 biotin carboxyl carrier protein /biotin carboxylase [Acidocella aminolytica 101 = DSM 11237]
MKTVLIANRGEIAVRIIRACHDYGLRAVAAYADPDEDSLFVRLADEAYALHGTSAAETYLDIPKLLAIAKRAGADAVHPGYGFLSERAVFARAVQAEGLTWIGPDPAVIAALGDKISARDIAQSVGAPLAAGSDGPVDSAASALAFARQHGLPLAIKAAHGGGGRGLKVVRVLEEVEEQYASAVREAEAAFGRGECFLERFLDKPRHIEVQIIADKHGNVVVLGTRDCSLQRRNQKLVEEAPAPFLTPSQRDEIEDAARRICQAAGYSSAGTVEFLLGQDGTLSFLEVNTRLQVEHPVTEQTTGIDLVIEQFRVAEGLKLSIPNPPPAMGHAIEFRINAEDAAKGFLPTPGRITLFEPPSGPGVRLDSGVVTGSLIPGQYDSLAAKLIVTGSTRAEALRRARRALAEFTIEGVATVLPFHRAVLEHPSFTGENGFGVYTSWIETEFQPALTPAPRPALLEDDTLLRLPLEIDGRRHQIGLPRALLNRLGQSAPAPTPPSTQDNSTLYAPVAGHLQGWKVEDGAEVQEGDLLAVMEAMKMEVRITSPRAGCFQQAVKTGAFLEAGAALGRFA